MLETARLGCSEMLEHQGFCTLHPQTCSISRVCSLGAWTFSDFCASPLSLPSLPCFLLFVPRFFPSLPPSFLPFFLLSLLLPSFYPLFFPSMTPYFFTSFFPLGLRSSPAISLLYLPCILSFFLSSYYYFCYLLPLLLLIIFPSCPLSIYLSIHPCINLSVSLALLFQAELKFSTNCLLCGCSLVACM